MTPAKEKVLVETVEGLTVEFQELVVRLEVHLGTKWVEDSLRTVGALNTTLCAAFPYLKEGAE